MTLSTNQLRFLAERLVASTDREAAERIGITPRHVLNWKDEEEFRQRYAGVFEDGVVLALDIMRQHLAQAALTLVEGMKASGEQGPDWAARNTAARTLLQSHGLIREKRDVNLTGQLTVEQLAQEFEAWQKGRQPPTT